MTRVVLTTLAVQELTDAITYYETQQPGLGTEYRGAVRQALLRISKYPSAYPLERPQIRKCVLGRFPYNILYTVEKDLALVIAIANQHQRPNYWIDRL